MKIGRIIGFAGCEALMSLHLEEKPLPLKAAKRMLNLPVSLTDSRNAPVYGRIKSIIGRIDEPYAVITPRRMRAGSMELPEPADLIARPVYPCPKPKSRQPDRYNRHSKQKSSRDRS